MSMYPMCTENNMTGDRIVNHRYYGIASNYQANRHSTRALDKRLGHRQMRRVQNKKVMYESKHDTD